MVLLFPRSGLRLLKIVVTGYLLILQTVEINVSSCFFRKNTDSRAVQPLFLGNIFFGWSGNFTVKGKWLEEAEETASWGREHRRERSNKSQEKEQLGCRHRCQVLESPLYGRNVSHKCHLQWKWSSTPIFDTAPNCWISLSGYPRGCKSGRRCRRLHLRSWTVDSFPNATGQAKRNNLRCPDFRTEQACSCSKKLNSASTRGSAPHGLLMLENQRSEGRRKGKGGVFRQVLVSLVAFYLLFLGNRHGQAALTVLKERLLCLLPEFISVRKPKECNTKGQTAKRDSPDQRQRATSSLCSKHFSQSKKAYQDKDAALDSEDTFGECPFWLFRANLFTPYTSLWVAPGTSFLPSTTAQDSSTFDHVGLRLASLAALPPSCTLSRVRLADAGFHFNPSSNAGAVQCHRCLVLYSLEQEAGAPGPLQFHMAASPVCPVVKALSERHQAFDAFAAVTASASLSGDHRDELSEDSEGRGIQAGRPGIVGTAASNMQRSESYPSDIGYVLALNGSNIDHRNEPTVPDMTGADCPSFSATQSSRAGQRDMLSCVGDMLSLSLSNAVYPQFSTTQSRLNTYGNWPAAMAAIFPPQFMVDLGFYYAGYADCVRCFYCGVGLKSWEAHDDPLTEHVRWRPECGFLLATRGKKHVQQLLQRIDGASEAVTGTNGSGSRDGSAPSSGSGDGTSSSGSDDSPSVERRLFTMGFLAKDIHAARTRVRELGLPEDLPNLQQFLTPN